MARRSRVDHFVPRSRYPADLGRNFVPAHDKCNSDKSDHLAAERHIAAWVTRNRERRVELQARLTEAGLPCDQTAAERIAEWVYRQTETAGDRCG